MSRLFKSELSQYLEYPGAVLSGYPLTLACRFRLTSLGTETLISLSNNSSNSNGFHIRIDINGAAICGAGDGSGINLATTSVASRTTTSVWGHVCGVFTSSTSRAVFMNGSSKATAAGNKTPTGINVSSIGRRGTISGQDYTDGRIADAAVWSAALTDDEVAALGNGGASPLDIRRAALVAYWPLVGRQSPEPDIVGGFDMVVNGPTLGESPDGKSA